MEQDRYTEGHREPPRATESHRDSQRVIGKNSEPQRATESHSELLKRTALPVPCQIRFFQNYCFFIGFRGFFALEGVPR